MAHFAGKGTASGEEIGAKLAPHRAVGRRTRPAGARPIPRSCSEGAEKYDIRVEAFMAQPDASRLHQPADDAARHEFSIPIARTMKLQDIQEAHRIFERGGLSGKIVLVP
jgi:hypothetical protein